MTAMTLIRFSNADPRKQICCEASPATSTYSRCSSRPNCWCLRIFGNTAEVTLWFVFIFCLVQWNTWINGKTNESAWTTVENQSVFNGIFSSALWCTFRMYGNRLQVQIDFKKMFEKKCFMNFGVLTCFIMLQLTINWSLLWFSIAARCTT